MCVIRIHTSLGLQSYYPWKRPAATQETGLLGRLLRLVSDCFRNSGGIQVVDDKTKDSGMERNGLQLQPAAHEAVGCVVAVLF